MSAQLGGSLILDYGPQGDQQNGGSLVLEYTSDVIRRRLVAGLRAPWAAPTAVAVELRALDIQGITLDVESRARWVPGTPLFDESRAPWGVAEAISESTRAAWGRFGARPAQELYAPWGLARAMSDEIRAPWGSFSARSSVELYSPWGKAVKLERDARAAWGEFLKRLGLEHEIRWGTARRPDREYWLPWTKFSRQLNPDWGIPQPPGGPPVDGDGTIIIPAQGVYIVINSVSLIRVSDAVQIPAFEASLSLDNNSWSWSFNASVPRTALGLIQRGEDGTPVEVELALNGELFRFVIEDISGEREFPTANLRIAGRSKSAGLADPYVPTMDFFSENDRTAEQLANEVLTDNGVPLGWSLVFDPVDWLVPAGAWSHRGTYISALNTIAAAAGGYLQPHDVLDEMRIRLQYPAAPWNWADVIPDLELPAEVTMREGLTWQLKPTYDRVIVQGQAPGGVQGDVVREGTGGLLLAQQVVDPLITHVDAARQRGIPVLADTGRFTMVELRLPVLEDTGVIRPGTFVRYVDGGTTRVGLVRSVSVSVTLPSVTQTITVETHGF